MVGLILFHVFLLFFVTLAISVAINEYRTRKFYMKFYMKFDFDNIKEINEKEKLVSKKIYVFDYKFYFDLCLFYSFKDKKGNTHIEHCDIDKIMTSDQIANKIYEEYIEHLSVCNKKIENDEYIKDIEKKYGYR